MEDMFKSRTLHEDTLLPVETRTLAPISDCPPVPKPKKAEKPKLRPRKENPERSYKLPGKEDGPDTEAAFAKWENPVDLNNFIDPIPEGEGDAFDALMGMRRRQAGEGRRRSTRASSPRSSRRRPRRTEVQNTFTDLSRDLFLSDQGRRPGPPPPFRGI